LVLKAWHWVCFAGTVFAAWTMQDLYTSGMMESFRRSG
jgi:hypothetical protein